MSKTSEILYFRLLDIILGNNIDRSIDGKRVQFKRRQLSLPRNSTTFSERSIGAFQAPSYSHVYLQPNLMVNLHTRSGDGFGRHWRHSTRLLIINALLLDKVNRTHEAASNQYDGGNNTSYYCSSCCGSSFVRGRRCGCTGRSIASTTAATTSTATVTSHGACGRCRTAWQAAGCTVRWLIRSYCAQSAGRRSSAGCKRTCCTLLTYNG
jgi:hypothetical protein